MLEILWNKAFSSREYRDSFVLSSESCGLDIIGAELIRDVEPGEIIVIKEKKLNQSNHLKRHNWDLVYLNTYIFHGLIVFLKEEMFMMLEKIGRQLAIENKNDENKIDVVIPIPDSGNASALGYSEKIKNFWIWYNKKPLHRQNIYSRIKFN